MPSNFGKQQPRARTALAALAATAALGFAAASPATAATPAWGYEQITPASSSSLGFVGMGASKDMSTVVGTTRQSPLPGFPSDGRGGNYGYGLPRGGAPWSMGPIDQSNYLQAVNYMRGVADDGALALWSSQLPSVDGQATGFYRVDRNSGAENAGIGGFAYASSDDLRVQAFRSTVDPGNPVKVSSVGQAPVVVSVDNTGAPMTTLALGGSPTSVEVGGGGFARDAFALMSGALAADGSAVIFMSNDALSGDNDGQAADIYRRTLTAGAEQTILISDGTPGGGADVDTEARYRWATADQQHIFFTTKEGLEPGDTDNSKDVYLRAGTSAPVRISQGETVDGAPTGNAPLEEGSDGTASDAPEWVVSSADGNRTVFVTSERLTQDAPGDASLKLYERDVAEGRTRFVAGPLSASDVGGNADQTRGNLTQTFYQDVTFRGIRVTPDGAVFMSQAPLGGAPDDGQTRVFVWKRGESVKPITTASAHFLAGPSDNNAERAPFKAGRSVSDDGEHVFLVTGTSLSPEDTDEHDDIYVWSEEAGLRLVTPPGDSPHPARYIDSSPDGREVYFTTSESILPSDTDPNAADVYLAILGGGAAPSDPPPDADPQVCTGDACQGPLVRSLPPTIGSLDFTGRGNVLVPPDPVEASVSVAKVKPVRGSVAPLRVTVSMRGRIDVSGPGLTRTSKTVSQAGTYRMSVRLSQAARKTLKRKHRVRVRATVRLTPQEGRSVVKPVTVTFTFTQAPAKQSKKASATTRKGGR